MDPNRQHWSEQQQCLRRLLTTANEHQSAMRLLLRQHAMLHAAAMAWEDAWSFEDEVLDGLAEDQTRECPRADDRSVAWLIWHITRIEDVTMNLLVAGRP